MATLTGKLANIVGQGVPDVLVNGTIEMMLCGYGAQVPRVAGAYVLAQVTESRIGVDETGAFGPINFNGNDVIIPAGTYYTVTVKDENGDIVQVNAYQFFGATDYDLSTVQPFDPSLPPAVIPPLIIPQAEIANGGPSYEFSGDEYTTFVYNLDQNATVGVSNPVIGNLYTFIIHQDSSGSHTLTWPYYIVNATPINPEPNGTTIQTFVASERMIQGQLILYSIAPPTWWTT